MLQTLERPITWEARMLTPADGEALRALCGGQSLPLLPPDALPDALREAKASLAQATVAQLKQAGWDALRRDPDTSAAMRAVLDLRLERADSFRPFADEHYWGGFVCHRCR